MKNYSFIPHQSNMRSNSQVLNLIDSEGGAGYGLYWALLEYLREQSNYTGHIRAVKIIAKQLKIRNEKALRVLNDYGLFIVEDTSFHSPFLDEKMANMKRKSSKVSATDDKSVSEVDCNSLKTNDNVSKNKKKIKNKNKNKEEDTSSPISSSSSSEGKEAAAVVEAETMPVTSVPDWEKLVDELQTDEQWLELVAMRSGLNENFYSLLPRILENFKRHVRSIGNEGRILSISDAKHYFFFFLNPGSTTYKNLIQELRKPVDKGEYRFEDHHPSIKPRSYCGVPIPDDAPPRPNNQACWHPELKKWFY